MTVRGVISAQGNDLSALINEAAAASGLPTQALAAQLWAESRLDEQAERDGVWPDWSVGLGQQTGKYAVVGDGTASEANKAVVRAYYFQPANAIRECARQLGVYYAWFTNLEPPQRYYEAASRYNGGPALAFADNPNRRNIMAAWAAAGQYEVADVPTPTPAQAYNPDYGRPAYQQRQDWTCSVCATAWALGSLGYPVTPAGLQDLMVAAQLVTAASGLLEGNGSALAAWLHDTYGLTTERTSGAMWNWVVEHAGRGPVLLGGAAWYHWVGVRRALDADTVELANSADGYDGVHQTLTRDQYAALGPFAAIYLAAETAPVEDEVTQAEYDALKAQYDDLNNYTSSLTTDILTPTVAELHAAATDPKARRIDLQATLERIALRLTPFVGE